MTLIVSMLLLMFGLDPTTGKVKIYDPNASDVQVIEKPDARQEATLASTTPGLLSPVTTSTTPEGVYVDTAKNGQGVVQPATAEDTKNEMEQMRKIKVIVDTVYYMTKN